MNDDDVVLQVTSKRKYPAARRHWDELLVALGLGDRLRIYSEELPTGRVAIRLGRAGCERCRSTRGDDDTSQECHRE